MAATIFSSFLGGEGGGGGGGGGIKKDFVQIQQGFCSNSIAFFTYEVHFV